MSNWIIHFLISNIFICIFTLVIIGTKKLLKKYLSAATQYHLCFLLFLLLAVPFFPVQIHGSQLFSWLHFFQTDSGLNSGTDTLSELTSNTQNILLNQVNDFSVSITPQSERNVPYAASTIRSTSTRALRKVSISSSVPMHTRSQPSGPTTRMSTPRFRSSSKMASRLSKCPPNSRKFEPDSATSSGWSL